MSAGPRPVTVLIGALGGEGGGVLTDWIVSAATALDLPVQSTSIPGVAIFSTRIPSMDALGLNPLALFMILS